MHLSMMYLVDPIQNVVKILKLRQLLIQIIKKALGIILDMASGNHLLQVNILTYQFIKLNFQIESMIFLYNLYKY